MLDTNPQLTVEKQKIVQQQHVGYLTKHRSDASASSADVARQHPRIQAVNVIVLFDIT